jgi:ABC-type branched-subunit amino acid transport system substrate-binding protein
MMSILNMRRTGWIGAAGAALLAALGPLHAEGQTGLSPAEVRGKQIYRLGTSARDYEVIASVGTEGVALPASAVPCASCHGQDGLGRPEGGVIPPDIRWSQLTKTYGHVHEDGRKHPAFDEQSLAKVLIAGVDSGGNRLDAAMPTYSMTDEDMADLIAYIKRLEEDKDPGITPERLQVATLLPLRGPQAGVGKAMAQVLHGYFKDVNARGGVFQRQVDLLVVPYGASARETLDNLRSALEQEGVFALVGSYTVGLDEPLLDLLRKEYVPIIGPFTLDPGDEILNTGAFYIYSGLPEQVRVLADKALEGVEGEGAPLLVVGPEGPQTERLAAAAGEQVRAKAGTDALVLTYPAGGMDGGDLAAKVGESGSQALLFLGGQADLSALLPVLAQRGVIPRVYLLGALVSHSPVDAPETFDQRIFLAYPTLPQDISPAGRTEYQALAQRHGLPPQHIQGQLAALAAGKLLVEGLRRAGRDLNREALERAIEDLYQFETGITPPLSYGPTRRVGARGAHLMVVDLKAKEQRPIGPWIELR